MEMWKLHEKKREREVVGGRRQKMVVGRDEKAE